MAKTKTTPRKAESKKKVPPLAWPTGPAKWGTAACTFHRWFKMTPHLNRRDCKYKGLTVDNLPRGTFYKPPAGGKHRWRLGTQVLREIRNLIRTMNLCIPKLPFIWLVREITFQEVEKANMRQAQAPYCHIDISESRLKAGERNICLLRWTKGALEALHKGTENYLCTLMEDVNLLAIHAQRYSLQPRDIQLAR